MSMVPSALAMKKTPGRVGDHSASLIRFENDLVWRSAPLNTFSRQMLNPLPPATSKMSLKKGDLFMATIGPSSTNVYHSAFEAFKFHQISHFYLRLKLSQEP